jgi:ABC-type branched-subunit amino acid transport system ATPase component
MSSDKAGLFVEDLFAGYNVDVDILKGVSVDLKMNEIVSVIGPNGAGKSTLMKAILGLVPVKSGRIRLNEAPMIGLRPSAIARLGIGYVPQRENVFAGMTVAENLEIGLTPTPQKSLLERREVMFTLFPRLAERRRQNVGSMSGGERQMVAIARALMPEPQVLLLDEPSAGLAPLLVDAIFEQIFKIYETGVAILMVEQNARRALAISNRAYVLDLGQNRHTGSGKDLLDDPRVAELYLGGINPATSEREKDHQK